MLVFVVGGARSGKSELAERWVERLALQQDGAVTYVATGWAADDAMADRIAAHRDRRPPTWATVEVEQPATLPATLAGLHGIVLLDALGTWVARQPDFVVDVDALCDRLRRRAGDTVVVSDEVGLGVHPETAVGNRFRDALGRVNRAVADVADRAVFVVAGRALPLHPWDDVLP